jgi:2-polyprenyl-3-methyl-5-hydroxy-6-metoxy-1,4-benzoquinol methylase
MAMETSSWDVEAKFFDAIAEEHGPVKPMDPLTLRRYTSPLRRRFVREFRVRSLGPLAGKRVLDVGCGEGGDSVLLAKLGAKQVTGVDLSERAIIAAREHCLINGVADRVDFLCAPLETAGIAPESYDVVWCNAILHHLTANLDLVMQRLAAWAKPDGLISLAEPTAFNRTLRRLRLMVPLAIGTATPDERPLERADFAVIEKYVTGMEVRHFLLFGRIDQFVLSNFNYERSSLPRRAVVNLTAFADWLLLSLPGVKNLGSVCVAWARPNKAALQSAPLAVGAHAGRSLYQGDEPNLV